MSRAHPVPSIQTIMDGLIVDRPVAVRIREVLEKGSEPPPGMISTSWDAYERRSRALAAVCDLLGGFEVTDIPDPLDESRAIATYANMGDTYITTLLWSCRARRFYVTSWGDWYERSPEYRAYQRVAEKEGWND